MATEMAPVSRSERRLFKRLTKAEQIRDDRLQKGIVSLPSGQGILAIFVSGGETFPTNIDRDKTRANWQARMAEAEQLKEAHYTNHQHVSIEPATSRALEKAYKDPEVTDIKMIGHGTMNCLMLNAGEKNYYTWIDALKHSSHLKQGEHEQRTCANFPTHIWASAPVGTFVTSRLSDVKVALGTSVPLPESGLQRDYMFGSVYNDDMPAVEQIMTLNERHRDDHPVIVEMSRDQVRRLMQPT